MKGLLLAINCIILTIGNCGGPLITRLYFLHGGNRLFLSSWLQTAGWPLILIPLGINYARRRLTTRHPKVVLMNRRVFLAGSVIGFLTGLSYYLYVNGLARLPVSTSLLVLATELVFTAMFSFLMVRQRFTMKLVNTMVLLTMGAVVLGVHASGDKPVGESNKEYWTGFAMLVGAAVLYGFILPAVELTYTKAKVAMTYTLVLEFQLVTSFFATIFATVGMLINKDFQAISKEAMAYELGETKYFMVITWCAIIYQCLSMGITGVIFCSSSLFSAIVVALLLPITEILAVIFFHEEFHVEKGISLFLSLWGFGYYFYGECKREKINGKNTGENDNDNDPSDNRTAGEAHLAQQIEGP